MTNPQVIKRGKVTYVIYDDRILAGISSGQWTSYNPYENWNRAGITLFINAIKKSKENEYGTAPDFMTLAAECGIRGISARPPKDAEL